MAATSKYVSIITEGQTVRMVYRRADGDITERVVTVDRVWECTQGMAFVGFCQLRQERRTFSAAHVLYAMVDDGSPIRSFTACEMLEASTARLMAAHRSAILRSEHGAVSNDRLSGWD